MKRVLAAIYVILVTGCAVIDKAGNSIADANYRAAMDPKTPQWYLDLMEHAWWVGPLDKPSYLKEFNPDYPRK